MPSVIHSDLGREFENKVMQELCLLCGAHKTRMTPRHPKSDGLVERFNRTLLMMLALFAGEKRDDWDDLSLAVMMAYRSSVHESTGYSPYRLMFGEECALLRAVGLLRQDPDLPDPITSPYDVWVRDGLEVAYDQVRRHSGQAVQRRKRLYDRRSVRRLFAVGDSAWVGLYRPSGVVSWIDTAHLVGVPTLPVLDASTMNRTTQGFPSIAVLPPDEGAVLPEIASDGVCTVLFGIPVLSAGGLRNGCFVRCSEFGSGVFSTKGSFSGYYQ